MCIETFAARTYTHTNAYACLDTVLRVHLGINAHVGRFFGCTGTHEQCITYSLSVRIRMCVWDVRVEGHSFTFTSARDVCEVLNVSEPLTNPKSKLSRRVKFESRHVESPNFKKSTSFYFVK